MPTHARSDIQTDFAEMLVGFLILERFDNLAQREMTINNRAHAISIDGSNHILLPAAAFLSFGRYPLVSLNDQFPRYVEKP